MRSDPARLPRVLSLSLLSLLSLTVFLTSCGRSIETRSIDLVQTPLFETQNRYLVVVDDYVRSFEIKDSSSPVIKVFRRGSIQKLLEQGEKVGTNTWYAINDSGRVLWISAKEVKLCVLEAEALLYSKRLY